jgi:hypothetical protein
MSFPANRNFLRNLHFQNWLFALAAILPLLYCSSSTAGTDLAALPPEYGEVIYCCNEKSPSQLFIIGMSHRDSITRLNGLNTSRVQAEVYKLGEWLIRNRGLELLLPEGFFRKKPQAPRKIFPTAGRNDTHPAPLDIKILEERLSDTTSFINAEMLLMRNYHLRTQQVEDPKWYDAVANFIRKLAASKNANDYYLVRSELDYLQERRTAAMLQEIPGIIDAEYQQGSIKGRKAFFTIGMSHLYKIIKYLDANKIKIYSPLADSNQNGNYVADLNLRRENFGVVIIIPRTLADDQRILEINRLTGTVEKSRKHS